MSVDSPEAVASRESETVVETPMKTLNDLVPSQTEIDYCSDENVATCSAVEDKVYSCEEGYDYDDVEGSTFWDMLSTWYLPFLFVWLRRSMFGTVNLVRSVLVGQCIRLLLTQCGDVPKWAQPFADPHAWPPPAFTVLALLTFVAFVVHPDGLTWLMLGKLRYVYCSPVIMSVDGASVVQSLYLTYITLTTYLFHRDAVLSLLQSMASCWTIFIQDYGIITTTIALMTLVGLACLLGILLRNAVPKASSKRNLSHDKKKKKRKWTKGKGRLRPFRKVMSGPEPASDMKPVDEDPLTKVHEESIGVSTTPSEEYQTEMVPKPQGPTPDTPSTTTLPRPRVLSSSTVDTVRDDASCDSISVRSFSSAPTAVTVGSTGNSESGKSSRRSSRASCKMQQKYQVTNGTTNVLGGGGGKVFAVDDRETAPSLRHASASPKPILSSRQNHPHDGFSRPMVQTPKPNAPATGRFANLKEKDTRFDNHRRCSNRPTSSKARIIPQGRNSRYANVHPSELSPSRVSAKQPYDISSQRQVALTPQRKANSNQDFVRSVQYGSTYSPDVFQTTQKKTELGSFIATVGIVGDDAAALVANVPDIDGLASLSDIQFQLYGVGADKQAQLGRLLEQRLGHPSCNIRPPPGLSLIHDEPPTLFGSPNRTSPPNLNLSRPVLKPPSTRYLASHPFAYDENQYEGAMDEEESRIEAELQELGGKMIGSVLDF